MELKSDNTESYRKLNDKTDNLQIRKMWEKCFFQQLHNWNIDI